MCFSLIFIDFDTFRKEIFCFSMILIDFDTFSYGNLCFSLMFMDFDTFSYGDLCFSSIFIDTHLALAWGGGGREMAAMQDDFALHEGCQAHARNLA